MVVRRLYTQKRITHCTEGAEDRFASRVGPVRATARFGSLWWRADATAEVSDPEEHAPQGAAACVARPGPPL